MGVYPVNPTANELGKGLIKKVKELSVNKLVKASIQTMAAMVLMGMVVACQASDKVEKQASAQPETETVKKQPTMDEITATIQKNIPDMQVDEVRTTPMDGVYEIRTGVQLFYGNASGTYVIAGGNIFDTKTRENLTKARLEEINKVDWKILPLDKAIVSGDLNAEKAIAVFTDPDCPYCRRLEEELKQIDSGVKVYTFLFPLESLHPDAKAKSESIWCAEDQHEALLKVMLEDQSLPKATCATPVSEVQELGRSLGISGTPTVIASDGRKFSGYKRAAELKAWLLNN